MLTGSFASGYHGAPRASQDIDIVIAPTLGALNVFLGLFSGNERCCWLASNWKPRPAWTSYNRDNDAVQEADHVGYGGRFDGRRLRSLPFRCQRYLLHFFVQMVRMTSWQRTGGSFDKNSAFLGPFALSGMAVSQAKADAYLNAWLSATMDDTPCFQGSLRGLFLLLANHSFPKGP
jgi:hypothetical protein